MWLKKLSVPCGIMGVSVCSANVAGFCEWDSTGCGFSMEKKYCK